ncbi:response regulator [Azohydromonas lata]|uniref:Response regulator transcription factor n=1 Tax=Azohydromonas lata TaxID=45677 RepID=A0ABU5IQU6_9BURK|nr:response regulator transcription factor [Azohydromonas lata]MDZ5461275.1 response regulator transcription factor [Azohydromonas lata]
MTFPLPLSDTGPTGQAEPAGDAPARIRLLVADDHHVVLDGLSTILDMQADMQVVAQASDGAQAVELWVREHPDVGLIDLSMPRLTGVEAITAIRRHEPRAKLIILTTYDGDEDIYRGLHAGAKAYLLKDVRRDELLRCIRVVHEGGHYINPELAGRLASRLTRDGLSQREMEVLVLIERGLSNKLIARELQVAEGTVKTHVKAILAKLEARSRTEAIAIGVRRGLLKR